MKNLPIYILTIILAVGATLATQQMVPVDGNGSDAVAEESAYERIMRTDTIRCGYAMWPPYLFKDPNTGQVSGINYDVMEAMGKLLSLEIDWVEETSWATSIEGLNTGRYDVFCATLWPDGPRTKQSTLTIPTFYSAVFAYVRSDDMRFEGDLEKLNVSTVTVVGLEGDVTYDVAATDFPKAKVLALPQLSEGGDLLRSVATGKADVTFVDEGIARTYNENNEQKLRKVEGVGPVRVFGEVHAVKVGEFQLKNLLDTTITTLVNSGVIEKYINDYENSYFPVREEYKK